MDFKRHLRRLAILDYYFQALLERVVVVWGCWLHLTIVPTEEVSHRNPGATTSFSRKLPRVIYCQTLPWKCIVLRNIPRSPPPPRPPLLKCGEYMNSRTRTHARTETHNAHTKVVGSVGGGRESAPLSLCAQLDNRGRERECKANIIIDHDSLVQCKSYFSANSTHFPPTALSRQFISPVGGGMSPHYSPK